MDTQLGSIKHITLQLPSFGTSALLIARFFMAMFGIGSLNLMCRLSSSVVGKTNTSFSLHSLHIISYFHWWKRHIKQLYFKTSLTFLYLLFHNRRNFELDKADCLLKDYLLWSAGSMCSSCHGFEETTPERWNERNLKKGFILTGATEAWWENNSKEDIENTNDRMRRKLELHRYK